MNLFKILTYPCKGALVNGTEREVRLLSQKPIVSVTAHASRRETRMQLVLAAYVDFVLLTRSDNDATT